MTTLELQRDAATIAADQVLYFDMLAEMGHTKHIGGLAATMRLMELIKPQESHYLLDVGCGVGIAPAFLAQQYGCRVVAWISRRACWSGRADEQNAKELHR